MSSGTYTAAANINQGDVVCLAGNNFPQPPLVRTATPDVLATAPIVGVALAAALEGQPVTVADAGGVQQSITGLPGGAHGPVAVSGTGRCTAILAGAAWLIGEADRFGDLEIRPRPFEFLDVRSFGAVGDGSTDDRAAIQAAISAFGSAAGTLVFSVGTFMVGSAVTFPPNLQLSFENGGALKRGANLNVTIAGQVQAGPRTACLLAANLSDGAGYVLSSQHEAWWHWFGAVADSTTNGGGADNTGAIQAAINAMSQQHSQAFEGMGGARCLGAPGYYRVAGGLNLKGAGMEFGGVGGLYGPTILLFDNGVGTPVQGDSFVYCLTVVQETAPSRADGLTIRNLSMVQGSGGQVGWQIFTNTALTKCTAIGIRSPFVSLHNVYISGFTGKGIDFSAGGVADDTTFDNVFVQNCGIYGIHVHGGDSNVNSLGGQVTILNCGSWGIVDSSFLAPSGAPFTRRRTAARLILRADRSPRCSGCMGRLTSIPKSGPPAGLQRSAISSCQHWPGSPAPVASPASEPRTILVATNGVWSTRVTAPLRVRAASTTQANPTGLPRRTTSSKIIRRATRRTRSSRTATEWSTRSGARRAGASSEGSSSPEASRRSRSSTPKTTRILRSSTP